MRVWCWGRWTVLRTMNHPKFWGSVVLGFAMLCWGLRTPALGPKRCTAGLGWPGLAWAVQPVLCCGLGGYEQPCRRGLGLGGPARPRPGSARPAGIFFCSGVGVVHGLEPGRTRPGPARPGRCALFIVGLKRCGVSIPARPGRCALFTVGLEKFVCPFWL